MHIEQEIDLMISSNAMELLEIVREDFQRIKNEFIGNHPKVKKLNLVFLKASIISDQKHEKIYKNKLQMEPSF